MIVLNPTNPSHQIKIIPRFSPVNNLLLEFYNEVTKEITLINVDITNAFLLHENSNFFIFEDGIFFVNDIKIPYQLINGILFIHFDMFVKEGQKYQLKIMHGNDILYRGKVFSTTQKPQEFKATKELYYYE